MPLDHEDEQTVREIVREEVKGAEQRLTETMREMQTEILLGLERFARGNFARLHRLESSDADLSERLNALEERVLTLETRPQNGSKT